MYTNVNHLSGNFHDFRPWKSPEGVLCTGVSGKDTQVVACKFLSSSIYLGPKENLRFG